MGPAEVERRNPNYVGGDINGGVQDLRQLFTRPVARLVPYSTPVAGPLHLLVVDAAGRGRARDVRVLCGSRRAATDTRLNGPRPYNVRPDGTIAVAPMPLWAALCL